MVREEPTAPHREVRGPRLRTSLEACLLYTSDAADERSSVDLGGRRIIKKKKNVQNRADCARIIESGIERAIQKQRE